MANPYDYARFGEMSMFNTRNVNTPRNNKFFNSAGVQVDATGKPIDRLSWMDKLGNEMAKSQQAAKMANLERYNQGMSLLGLDQNGKPLKTEQAAEVNPVAPPSQEVSRTISIPSMTAGKITEPGAAVQQSGVDNGVYGSGGNTALSNRVALTNSIALREQDRADRELAMRGRSLLTNEAQRAEGMNYQKVRDAEARADQMRNQRLSWIEGRNDTYPDTNVMATLAGQLGKGSTDGLSGPTTGYSALGSAQWLSPQSIGFGVPSSAYGYWPMGDQQGGVDVATAPQQAAVAGTAAAVDPAKMSSPSNVAPRPNVKAAPTAAQSAKASAQARLETTRRKWNAGKSGKPIPWMAS